MYITQTEKGKKQSKSEEKVKFTVGDLTNYNLLKEKVEFCIKKKYYKIIQAIKAIKYYELKLACIHGGK